MKYKIMIVLSIILIGYLFSQTIAGSSGEGAYFFAITDPVGDDYGPGSYRYPTHQDFSPGEGLFDITSFRIGRDGEDYLLEFQFEQLTDPWVGKYGFSHPLIQLYIDNQEGGITELFREGANISLDPGHPWDHLLSISGWWVRAFTPADRDREDDFWNTGEDPWEVEESEIMVRDKEITVRIRQSLLGSLEEASIFLMVGGFDPFGLDYFRQVDGIQTNWKFSDSVHENLEYAPRVIDLIPPPGRDQAVLLSNFDDGFPRIYPFRVSNSKLPGINLYFIIIPVFVLLAVILILVYKKDPFRDTKG